MSKDSTLYVNQTLEAIKNIYADIEGKDLEDFRADKGPVPRVSA